MYETDPTDSNRTDDLVGWIPATLPCDDMAAYVTWQFAGNSKLDDSIFYQTVERLGAEYPNHPRRRADLTSLLPYFSGADGPAPTAFVFHMGRCGSTVLSNAFRAITGGLSLSEPEPVSALMLPYAAYRWPYSPSEWEQVKGDLLRGAIAALGQRRLGYERRYFLKFAEWNVVAMKYVRSLYPDTPFVYMYRDPFEVVSSFLYSPPRRLLLRTLPARMFGMTADQARSTRYEEYCSRVVGRFCEAAKESLDDRTILFNYSQIGVESVLELFSAIGVDRSEIDVEGLSAVLERYAKDARPDRKFAPDGAAKRANLSDLARKMIDRWVEPGYVELEQMRMRGASV